MLVIILYSVKVVYFGIFKLFLLKLILPTKCSKTLISEQCTDEIYGYEAVLTKEMDYSEISLFQTI
jgi:hypothetical protein